MYVFLYPLIMVIIINCLYTIALTNSSPNKQKNRIDPIVRNLKHIVDTALQEDTSDDINNELLIEQLSRILEQEEGFRIIDRKQRSLYSTGDDQTRFFDGSGDSMEDEDIPPFYSNMSIIAFTIVSNYSS